MNKQEFEALTGKSVTAEYYARFESAYMNASQSFDKQKFCNAVRKAKPETLELIFDLSERVNAKTIEVQNLQHDAEMAERIRKNTHANYERIEAENAELSTAYEQQQAKTEALATALLLQGKEDLVLSILKREECIAIKFEQNMELSQADRQFIIETFKNI